LAALARRLGEPVSWVQTRSENLMGMPNGRGQLQEGELAVDGDGTFRGIWADLTGDAGAYPMVGALIPNPPPEQTRHPQAHNDPYRADRVGIAPALERETIGDLAVTRSLHVEPAITLRDEEASAVSTAVDHPSLVR